MGGDTMIAYYKLLDMLNKRNISKMELREAIKCGSNTLAALSKNEPLNTKTIDKICEFLNCQPGDIMEWLPNEKHKNKK